VASVAFSGDGQLVYTAAVDGVVQAWNADDGVPVWSGNMPGPVWSLAVSRDGRWVAAGEATGQMYLWDTSRLIGSRRMVQINGWPLSLAFDPRKESLFVQTAEWLHELSYGENPDIVASALLPAALPPGAWSVSADSAELARVLAVDSGGHRIVHLDLFGTSPGKVDVDAGSEVRWLDRLKLRFDATGALIPITAATAGSSPRSKPVGSIPGSEPAQAEPAFQFNDEDREGPPPGLEANPQ
jgi:hypothetical protein